MQFQIPISTLFTQVFGIAPGLTRKYTVSEDKSESSDKKYKIYFEKESEDSEGIKTQLGTPVQFPMGIDGGTYNKRNKGVIEKTSLPGMWLPFTSVASFTRSKRITETFMGGHQGSVIEEYGFEAWDIRIQGFILKNEYNVFSVEDKVKEMQQYEDLSDAVELKGKVFEWLKIYRAAILNITYPSARDLDLNHIRPYEMTLRSVQPIELII